MNQHNNRRCDRKEGNDARDRHHRTGGPEVLRIRELADPGRRAEDEVLIRVKAFGVNHAETHMRKGEWPEATPVSGIEAVGTVVADPIGDVRRGQQA